MERVRWSIVEVANEFVDQN